MTKALILVAAMVLLARLLGSALRPPPRPDRPEEPREPPSLDLARCRVCGEYSLPAHGTPGDHLCAPCRSAAAAPR